MIAAVRSELSVSDGTLFVAFELGKREWKLALTSGMRIKPMVRTVASGDWSAVERVIAQARLRLGLSTTRPVMSCYEAGRDGFWIHRALTARGMTNRVVDSASIAVDRRARRTKTDRIDALKLVLALVRVCYGEDYVWREVQVPTAEVEAARHRSRERSALVAETTRLRNQITSWLVTSGCPVSAAARRPARWWTTVRDWTDAPLPESVQERIARAEARRQLVEEQIAALETAQQAQTKTAAPASALARLVQLKGVATTSATVLLDEGLAWRAFANRRQLGGLLGFAPARYDSGETRRDQGISGAGNQRLQAVMTQLAWQWVHWQPASAITRWYQARFGRGQRARKVGIVAVARKLFIALWRWATAGILPTGAILKTA
jgi:transposase